MNAAPALFALAALLAAPVRAAETAAPEMPRDVRWVTDSLEYDALCRQIYRDAYGAVRAAAAETEGPWAVALDLDETVLDNSRYQIERYEKGLGYTPESWGEWVEREEAGLVPGAKEFLDGVRKLPGAHIVYITDRKAARDKHTLANLRRFKLFEDKTHILLARKDREDTKELRRACVEKGAERCAGFGPMPILVLIGDNIKDHVEVKGAEHAAEVKAGLASDPAWGTKNFLLPNPMYGSWERGYK